MRVTVMGLGRHGGGAGAARFFAARGDRVTVTDLAPPEALAASLAALADLPVRLVLGRHDPADFTDTDLVVASPAVPPDASPLRLARSRGIPVTTEIVEFLRRSRARTIAITGSNGKTTITALTHAMLAASGIPARIAGNIGISLLPEVASLGPKDTAVLEISSFQLEALPDDVARFAAAAISNISPNHLDRHGSFESYRAAKARILAHQGPDDVLVLNADDPAFEDLAAASRARVLGTSLRGPLPAGAWLEDGRIVARAGFGAGGAILDAADLRLQGTFNVMNVMQAALLALAAGADPVAVRRAAAEFPGVPHRLETVLRRDGVLYINDSKATTPEATRGALRALSRPVHLIAGGFDKRVDPALLLRDVAERAASVQLIGAVRQALASGLAALGGLRSGGPVEIHDSLEAATRRAATLAREGEIVLLSPAHASWDQFRDFEERGDRFRGAVLGSGSVHGQAAEPDS